MNQTTTMPLHLNITNQKQTISEEKAKPKKTPQQKIIRKKINGVFLLNKPLGLSSNAALQKVRWLFKAEKGGHTGALDPLATGLLPICLGEATKFSHYLLDADKRYQATIQLGTATTTADKEGEIIATLSVPTLDEALLLTVLQQFVGLQSQVPPMYSALKKEGKPLYELARQGIEVERIARSINITALDLLAFNTRTNSINIDVTCSKGTYIRTLAEDIGKALGTCAHLAGLHRIQTGHFILNPSYTIDYLETLTELERETLLLPLYAPVQHLRRIQLDDGEDFYFCRGQAVMVQATKGTALAFKAQTCLGLGEVDDARQFQPKRLINY